MSGPQGNTSGLPEDSPAADGTPPLQRAKSPARIDSPARSSLRSSFSNPGCSGSESESAADRVGSSYRESVHLFSDFVAQSNRTSLGSEPSVEGPDQKARACSDGEALVLNEGESPMDADLPSELSKATTPQPAAESALPIIMGGAPAANAKEDSPSGAAHDRTQDAPVLDLQPLPAETPAAQMIAQQARRAGTPLQTGPGQAFSESVARGAALVAASLELATLPKQAPPSPAEQPCSDDEALPHCEAASSAATAGTKPPARASTGKDALSRLKAVKQQRKPAPPRGPSLGGATGAHYPPCLEGSPPVVSAGAAP